MKAHVIIILFIYLLHYMNSYSLTYTQYDVLIKESISRYMINGKKTSCYIYSISNFRKEVVWLWFEREKDIMLSDSIVITRYFKHKKEGADGNLIQIATDHNVASYTPAVFDGFLKKIIPNSEFCIHVLFDYEVSDCEIQFISNYLNNVVVLHTHSLVIKIVPLIDYFNPIFLFDSNNIVFRKDLIWPP